MNKNDAVKRYNCVICNYATNRNTDLTRHQNAKHPSAVTPVCVNVELSECGKNVPSKEQNVPSQLICKKCKKIYKTKRCLVSHELKCKGINVLTCPTCMASFTTRQHKSRHILNNKCKPRSTSHAKPQNIASINTQNNIETQNNNIETQNNIDTQNIETYIDTQNNTFIINNYGNERMDYLDYDKMLQILKYPYTIPTMLTKHIHFNKEFPENNNIINNKNNENYPLVKVDDEYIVRNINSLVKELVNDKREMMHDFVSKNNNDICESEDNKINKTNICYLFDLIRLEETSHYYKKQLAYIKDLIKNSNPSHPSHPSHP